MPKHTLLLFAERCFPREDLVTFLPRIVWFLVNYLKWPGLTLLRSYKIGLLKFRVGIFLANT